MSESLLDGVHGLLVRAAAVAPPEDRSALDEASRRLAEPLRVAIAGRVKAGKSTLLNALVGEELAPTDASECTRVVTWYRNGLTYKIGAHLRSGERVPVQFDRADRAITIQLGAVDVHDVDHLEVEWPSRRLEAMTLIDTPGVGSLSHDVSARAHDFLEADGDQPAPADAVVYLMRHVHPGDVRLLESFRDTDHPGSPVSAVGVLSRADEIGACRLDAIDVAQRAASRYVAAPELRGLCLTVVPVAGLAAQAAATLTEGQFRQLAAVAQLPPRQLTELLLTVDRFAASDVDADVTVDQRKLLLERLGLYAVRVAVDAIRTSRVASSPQLARELLLRSGLPALQSLLALHFAGRSRMLKARTALAVLDTALHRHADAPGVEAVLRDAERLEAGAHEFEEVRILTALRVGALDVGDDRRDELVRLLGGSGAESSTRVGLDAGAPEDEIAATASVQLARWRRVADHPLSSRDVVMAAQAAVRTCEGILGDLAQRHTTGSTP